MPSFWAAKYFKIYQIQRWIEMDSLLHIKPNCCQKPSWASFQYWHNPIFSITPTPPPLIQLDFVQIDACSCLDTFTGNLWFHDMFKKHFILIHCGVPINEMHLWFWVQTQNSGLIEYSPWVTMSYEHNQTYQQKDQIWYPHDILIFKIFSKILKHKLQKFYHIPT